MAQIDTAEEKIRSLRLAAGNCGKIAHLEVHMRRVGLVLVTLLAWEASAFATWSVIAVDRSTGRVVISSSTCTGTTDDFLKDVQAVVVPGKGVAACQAGVDSATHQNQTLVFEELKRGTDPARIIEMLSEDPGFRRRHTGLWICRDASRGT